MSKIRYNNNIQEQIINEYINGISIDNLCKKYLISKSTIYRWINIRNAKILPKNTKDLHSILLENKKLKQEIDILKKAIEILSNKG